MRLPSLPDRETAMMSRARAFVLSALILALFAPALPAQKARLELRHDAGFEFVEHSSHQRLGGGLEEMTNPETALEERLSRSRRQRQIKDFEAKLDGDLGKLAAKFLQDKKFLESMKGQISPEEIEQLKAKLDAGKFSTNDKGFRDLLEKARTRPDLGPQERTDLDRFAEKVAKPDLGPIPPGPNPILEIQQGEPRIPPPSENLPGATPWQRDPSRSNDWIKGGLDGFIKNMDQWVDTPSGKSWAESLKNLAGRADAGRASTANLGERTSALSRWMGQMSGRNANVQPPRFGNPSLPNMPSLGTPSASLSGGSLAGSGSVLVVLLGLLLLGLILWRGRDWLTGLRDAGRSAWKIGPWPVRPEDVTTRGDLVRAFEYLALLCLGPAARTCHHLELGRQIGGQPALDAERRRESATALSRIYERARYTPDQEPLPGEDLRQARRELAYLAGAKA